MKRTKQRAKARAKQLRTNRRGKNSLKPLDWKALFREFSLVRDIAADLAEEFMLAKTMTGRLDRYRDKAAR